MRFPSIEEIIDINRRHIAEGGGGYFGRNNVMNEGGLEWVLEAIQHPLFAVDRYPGLEEKAAILAWTIIKDHVFFDGNKRTAMTALVHLVRLNRYQLVVSSHAIVDAAVRLATESPESYPFQEFVQWVRSRLVLEADNPELA